MVRPLAVLLLCCCHLAQPDVLQVLQLQPSVRISARTMPSCWQVLMDNNLLLLLLLLLLLASG